MCVCSVMVAEVSLKICFFFPQQIGGQFVKINEVGRWKEVGRDGGKKMRCGREAGISNSLSVV